MKKKGFTLIELLAVIIILALVLIIAIPRIMDSVREARMKAFENDVVALYKSIEKAYHEYELDFNPDKDYNYDFANGVDFGDRTLFSNDDYATYIDNGKECPNEFWASSKTRCQYFVDSSVGSESLKVVIEIPKGIQSYYSDDACQLVYDQTNGFDPYNCGGE